MKFKNRKKRGFVLPLVICIVLIMLLVGYSLATMGFESRVESFRKACDIKAKSAADAGLSQALYKLNDKLARESVWISDVSSIAESNVSLPNSDSSCSFSVTGNWMSGYLIESVGVCRNITRRVYARTKLEGIFNFALLMRNDISLYPGSGIEAFNSSTGATGMDTQIAINSTDAGSIILQPGVTVNGDILVGLGGDPDEVIDSKGTITGITESLPQPIYFPVIYAPSGLPSRGQIKNTVTLSPLDSGKYSQVDLGNSEIITIDGGDVVLYITGDIEFNKDAGITVENGSSLIIYIDGDWISRNDADINVESGIPSQLQIFGTGGEDQTFDLKAKSDFYGVLYAPEASVVLKANGDVYGAIVGESFESKSKSDFNYDTELGEVGINTEGAYFAIKNWREE